MRLRLPCDQWFARKGTTYIFLAWHQFPNRPSTPVVFQCFALHFNGECFMRFPTRFILTCCIAVVALLSACTPSPTATLAPTQTTAATATTAAAATAAATTA